MKAMLIGCAKYDLTHCGMVEYCLYLMPFPPEKTLRQLLAHDRKHTIARLHRTSTMPSLHIDGSRHGRHPTQNRPLLYLSFGDKHTSMQRGVHNNVQIAEMVRDESAALRKAAVYRDLHVQMSKNLFKAEGRNLARNMQCGLFFLA
jgi:hypothetical protein